MAETFSTAYGATPQTRTNVYVYDANGINLIRQISPLGEVTSYAYDSTNHLLFTTNAVNEVTSYTYDAQGRCTSITQPSGLVTTNFYYASGLSVNLLQTTIDLQINRTNSYTYTNCLLYTHTDERGLTTTNSWDALRRLCRVDYPDGTFVTNTYYRLDLVKTVDRMGLPTSYGYDGVRHAIAQTNALGAVTFYNYCACGALESMQDAGGNVTYFNYDNAGDLTSIYYPDGYKVYNNYDVLRHVTNTVDSAGISTTYWFNNQGMRYAISNAVGQVSFLQFDADYRVTNSVDANDVSVGMTYDPLGRLVTRSYPDGGVEGYGYSFGIAGPSSFTNQISKVTLYGYDAARRKTAETNALNNTTLFAYNAAADLLSLTDGNSDTTHWNYDAFGRVTNKVDAASNVLFIYKYDADNRLTNRWSAAKAGTTYKYDAGGNLTNVVYPVSPAITLTYDRLNRLTNMVDAVGNTVYSYDAASQLLSEDGPWANDTVSYSYQNRLRTQFSLLQPGLTAWSQSYGYDATRRLTSVTSPAGLFNYLYDPAQLQRVDRLTLPDGAVITNTYDSVARLTLTELMNSTGTNLDSYAYGYNQANQRTNVVRTAGDYVKYAYDNIGEVTTATGYTPAGSVRLPERLLYDYDAAGNLWRKRTSASSASEALYAFNSLNEITNGNFGANLSPWTATANVSGATTIPATNVFVNGSVASVYGDNTFGLNVTVTNGLNTFTAIASNNLAVMSTNTSTVNVLYTNSAYAYDLNGNLLADGTRGFAYDDENQLISVWKTNVWRNDFVYDGKMRRRIEKDFTWTNSVWTQTNEIHFIYDGNLVVQERNTNNQPVVAYTRGNDLSGSLQGAGGIGGLLARSQNLPPPTPFYMVHSYYHADGNGNVTMLVDASQNLVAKYLYDPYGNTLAQSGLLADANTYRFSSKEWNANSGLYYYLYRLYDPNLQRWINRDPLGEIGFESCILNKSAIGLWLADERSEGANLYEFVLNNPGNKIDPFGTTQDYGDCNKIQHSILNAAVAKACKQSGKMKCSNSDDCQTIKDKIAKFDACIQARQALNDTCFEGESPIENHEIANLSRGEQNCQDKLCRKNCK